MSTDGICCSGFSGAPDTLCSPGVVTILAAILVGGTIGSIAGYYGKIVDNCIMRVMDMMMTVPSLVLAMALVAAEGKPPPGGRGG